MPGFVIFNTIEDFNIAHEIANTFTGIPITGRRNGRNDSSKQRTERIARVRHKVQGVLDGTVVTHVKERFWTTAQVESFTLLRRGQVEEYFQPDLIDF